MPHKLIYIFSLVTLVSACGGGGSSSNSNDEITIPENDTNVSTVLEGTWLKSCSPFDQDDSGSLYDIVELSFDNNEFSSNILNYSDSLCSVPLSISPNPTASGDFTLGNEVVTSGGLTSTEVDTHIDTFNGAPFTVDEFNIFFIDSDTLYLGKKSDTNDGSSPALRPISLDFDRIFIKQ